jgi:hypothetical protein
MASTTVRAGFPTLYISSEMTIDEIFVKMVARETMTAYDIIYEYGFSPAQEERFLKLVNFKKETLSKKLVIEQTGIYGTSRPSILQAIDSASEFFCESPAQIVVDTIDHTEKDKFKKTNEAMGDTMNWISGVLEENDASGLITTQANREGSGETNESHVANTVESARVAQFIVAVNDTDGASRPDPQADNDQLMQPRQVFGSKTLSLVKARFGRTGDVPVSANLECAFIGDLEIEKAMK